MLRSSQSGVPLTTNGHIDRTENLRSRLLETVDALRRRRADLVSETLIADYVALHWLEWNGGTLRLTETGKNVCSQLKGPTAQP